MNNSPCPDASSPSVEPAPLSEPAADVVAYYSETGMDYQPWSANWNMHFGYWRRLRDLFKREAMLDAMNEQVLAPLAVQIERPRHLLDMGCGAGATARFAARRSPHTRVSGVTIVPSQIELAQQLAQQAGLASQLSYHLADYRQTGFPDNHFDGVYAIESSCHTKSFGKRRLLQEMYRVLKPGNTMVLADGMLRGEGSLHPVFAYTYQRVCRGWALGNFAHVESVCQSLRDIGFRNIRVRDIAWRVAPSVAHVPWVSLRYFMTTILGAGGQVSTYKWEHLWAPVFLLITALNRRRFGYYIISADK